MYIILNVEVVCLLMKASITEAALLARVKDDGEGNFP